MPLKHIQRFQPDRRTGDSCKRKYVRFVDGCRPDLDVGFGSLADLFGKFSLMSAFGGKADVEATYAMSWSAAETPKTQPEA